LNLLDLVPAFRRQLNQYIKSSDTDSTLSAYLADAVDALNWRWSRSYVVTNPAVNTYIVDPDVASRDIRPVVLMGSIIYKGSNVDLARFTDGDFAYDPQQGRNNPLAFDLAELDKMLPITPRLFRASTTPLRGFSNGYNPESYSWLSTLGVAGARY
jgi:hypothetical protein